MVKTIVLLALSSFLTSLPLPAAAMPAPADNATPAFQEENLIIAAGRHHHRFTVEMALTPSQQEYGLMNRRALDRHHGMLFLWKEDRTAAMWMKNTFIPLDMLLIDSGGKIVYIAAAVPHSLDIISAGRPVRAVLELKGGSAAALNIQTGDRVMHPAFSQ